MELCLIIIGDVCYCYMDCYFITTVIAIVQVRHKLSHTCKGYVCLLMFKNIHKDLRRKSKSNFKKNKENNRIKNDK